MNGWQHLVARLHAREDRLRARIDRLLEERDVAMERAALLERRLHTSQVLLSQERQRSELWRLRAMRKTVRHSNTTARRAA